jgi:hypothetical protein
MGGSYELVGDGGAINGYALGGRSGSNGSKVANQHNFIRFANGDE